MLDCNNSPLVTLGKSYVQKGIIKFSEFAAKLREDYTESTGKELELTDKEIAAQIFKPAMRSMEDPTVNDEDIQERGFGKRMSGNVPDPTQVYIDSDPEHDYDRQRLDVLKAELENDEGQRLVEKMDFLHLASELNSNTNVSVLAAGEMLKRAMAKDDDVTYQATFEALDKAGTVFGQLVRQLAEIKGGDPKFLINAFEKKLGLGGRFLSDEQKTKMSDALMDYSKKAIKAKDLFLKYVDSLSPNDEKEYRDSKRDADLSFIKYSKLQSSYDIRGFWETAGVVMKGNLLSVKSLLNNPLYNLFVNPFVIAGHYLSASADMLGHEAFGWDRSRTASFDQVNAQMKGFISGIRTAGRTMWHGVYPGEETQKLDSYRGLQPLNAIMQVITGKDLPQSKNKAQNFKDRYLTKVIESIGGITAEAGYRGLAIGDRPFWESAYNRRIVELAEIKGLKGDEYKRFLINPDLDSKKEAILAGDKATFQQASKMSKIFSGNLNNFKKLLYDSDVPLAGFVVDSVIPYVAIPTNVVYTYGKWLIPELHAPILGYDFLNMKQISSQSKSELENAINNGASQKTLDSIAQKYNDKMTDARGKTLDHLSEFAMSMALKHAAMWVLSKGVYTGPVERNRKITGLEYEYSRPGSLNIDALLRGFRTGDYSAWDGDKSISTDIMGIFGGSLAMQYTTKEAEDNAGVDIEKMNAFSGDAVDSSFELPSMIQFAFNQSFLKGMNTMMQAFATGNYDQIGPNFASSMSSVIIPNTWSAIARANRDYMLDKKVDPTDDWVGKSEWNAIKERTLLHPDLPELKGMFGEPIRQIPEGENPYVYQLVDVFKMGPVSSDPVVREIRDLYVATKDDSFIPLPPTNHYSIDGDKIILTKEETLQRQEMVGEMRYNAYRNVMTTDAYKASDPFHRTVILNPVLTEASSLGELQFEAYYLKQHPEIGKDIIKVKTGQEQNNGLNKDQ